jgi:hypothetical protein
LGLAIACDIESRLTISFFRTNHRVAEVTEKRLKGDKEIDYEVLELIDKQWINNKKSSPDRGTFD